MTPAPVGFADDGPAGMAPGRTCRLLLVVTESRQEAYLRRYAGALAAFQSAQIGVLRDCRGAGGAAECCQAELPLCGPDSPGAKRVLPAGAPLGACIGAIAGRWPFDMLIAEWPQADEHVALHARLVSELGVTAVLVRHSDGALRRVVVPAGGGAHALEGIRVADALARAWSLDRQVLRIVQPGSSFWLHRADLKRQCRHIRDATRLYLDVADVAMPVKVRLGEDVADEILSRCASGDLIVIGGSGQWLMENSASVSIPSRVACGAPGPVMMVLTNRGQPAALADVFWDRTIRVGLKAGGKLAAVETLVDALIEGRQVPAARRDEIIGAVMSREQAGTTYVGNQTAIPHAALPGFRGLIGMLGVFAEGVPFGTTQDEKARFAFLLLTPKESYEVYLPILARIARFMQEADNRRGMAEALNPAQVAELLSQAERRWRAEGR